MPWGVTIAAVLVLALIYFIYKTVSRFKISKSYISNALSKAMPEKTFDSDSIESEAIVPEQMVGEDHVQDKYYYHIKATDSEGEQHEFEGCLYDPGADYDEESFNAEQKKARPKDENMNSSGAGLASSTHSAGIELAQGMLRDQAKREKEDRIIEKRTKKYAIDVEITKKLNEYSEIVPKIYFYDKNKNFVLSEYAGLTLLKDMIVDANESDKIDVLKRIAKELAHAHNSFKNVSLLVPFRRPMTAEDFRKMLRQGLRELEKAKLLSDTQISDILNEYFSVAEWLGDNFERNIRFRAFTPYEIFVYNGKPLVRNWSEYDTSSEMTNLVEVLKDPTTDIDTSVEEDILRVYSESRFGDRKHEYIAKQYHLTSCHILTIQLCYMILYIKKKLETNVDTDVLVNWNQEHFNRLFNNALQAWDSYEESQAYAKKLKEVFESII